MRWMAAINRPILYGYILEKFHSLIHGHLKHVGNRLPFIPNLKCLSVIAFAMALLARHQYVGQKIHLYRPVTVALARLATATRHIEREPSRLVTANL